MNSISKSKLSKYPYKDKVITEVDFALKHFTGLKPKIDKHYFNDGTSKELLCLAGTIPITYQQQKYNIPVEVWILEHHPSHPPLAFVKPTSTMLVKQSKHVDANGRVYLPFLTNWQPGKSDVTQLLQHMIIIFNDMPPVYSKPTNTYPHYTPNQVYNQGMGQQMPQSGYQQGVMGQQQPYYQPPQSYSPYSSQNMPVLPSYQTAVQQQQQQPSQLGNDAVKASLISAINDTVNRRLKQAQVQGQLEIDNLRQTQEALRAGSASLEEMVARIEKEHNELDAHIASLKAKTTLAEESLEKMKNDNENFDIEDVINPSANLYKQILNLYAEECAIDDTIYHLSDALTKNIIDIDTFLKNVRSLSRKQFMTRALMQKARQRAGLREMTPH